MRRSSILLGLLCLVLSTGCGQGADKVATAPRTESALPSGWKKISTSGFSIAFPPDWKAIDLTAAQLDKGGDASMGNDPKMAQMRQMVKQMAASGAFKIFVFDEKKIGTAFANNCNVNVTPVPAGMTLEQAAEATKTQIAPMLVPGTEMQIDYVDLKAGHAGRFRSQLKMAAPLNAISSTAYAFVKGPQMTVVTFSSTKADEAEVSKMAEKVMETFEFTG
jgi:hypothetical protein